MPKSKRSYSHQTLKVLWGRAAGRCASPECRIDLVVDAKGHDPIVVIGDIAHIEAASNKGPRASRNRTAKERNSYENLILLCKNCHVTFDRQKTTNTVLGLKRLRTDHESWVRASLPERGQSKHGWRTLILQGGHPIDATQALEALSPDFPKGKPAVLSVPPGGSWPKAYVKMEKVISGFLAKGDPFNNRFAVFPLAPVSACLAAGYLLTNRPRVRLFQHHRKNSSWVWPISKSASNELKINGLPTKRTVKAGEVVICFHLSARIQSTDIPVPWNKRLKVINIGLREPSIHWLIAPIQLEALGTLATEVFAKIQDCFPNASRWHLFFSGPAPGAVKVGQQMNPTVTPPTQLYEFNRAGSPRFTPSILLGGAKP
jgi:5-methylcytosine-specific restriction endonuclease McrA